MTLKHILRWVLALWKFAFVIRESSVSELDLLRRLVELQGSIIGRLVDLCEDRFTDDEQSLHEIREIIAAQSEVSANIKSSFERGRFSMDQALAMLADMEPMIERMPDA